MLLVRERGVVGIRSSPGRQRLSDGENPSHPKNVHLVPGQGTSRLEADSMSLPVAVSSGVRPVVILAADPVPAGRPVAHVLQEVGEREPALYRRYASAAISIVRGIPRIKAAGHHPVPGIGGTTMVPAFLWCRYGNARKAPVVRLTAPLGGADLKALGFVHRLVMPATTATFGAWRSVHESSHEIYSTTNMSMQLAQVA